VTPRRERRFRRGALRGARSGSAERLVEGPVAAGADGNTMAIGASAGRDVAWLARGPGRADLLPQRARSARSRSASIPAASDSAWRCSFVARFTPPYVSDGSIILADPISWASLTTP